MACRQPLHKEAAPGALAPRSLDHSSRTRRICCHPARPPPFLPASSEVLSVSTPSDRKSTRLNSSHGSISYAVFCLKKRTPCTAVSYQRWTCIQTEDAGWL